MLCTAMLAAAHCIHNIDPVQAAAMTLTWQPMQRAKTDTMLQTKMRYTPLGTQRSNQQVTIYHSGPRLASDSESG